MLFPLAILLAQLPTRSVQQPAQEPGTLIQQVFGQPTGRNGYEEYVAAAQIATSGAYKVFENYNPTGKEPKSRQTLLDVWQEQLRRFGPIADLVASGNAKPVFDPRVRLTSSGSPELAGFPGVADYFVKRAYSNLANGDPDQSSRSLQAGLIFAANLDTGTEASASTAEECRRLLFQACIHDLSKFGNHELDRIADTASQLLQAEPAPIPTLRELRRLDVGLAERMVRNPRLGGSATSLVSTLSPEQRERSLRLFVADEDAYLQSVINVAGGPEAKWDSVSFGDQDAVSAEMSKRSIAVNPTPLEPAAKFRTRLRMLRLIARIYQFRWQNDRLPDSLDEAVKPAEASDPLSGSKFQFTKQDTTFDLQSTGAPWSGPVRLVERK